MRQVINSVLIVANNGGETVEVMPDGQLAVCYGEGYLTDYVTDYGDGKWAADFPDRWKASTRKAVSKFILLNTGADNE